MRSAWSPEAAPHPAGSRGHNVTSIPRCALRAMQSCEQRVNPEGTHRSLYRVTRLRWEGVPDGPSWGTENKREGDFPHPPAIGLELSSWDNPSTAPPSTPGQALREHKAVTLSLLLELSLAIQAKETPSRDCILKRIRPGREFKHDLVQLSPLTNVRNSERSRAFSKVTQLVS